MKYLPAIALAALAFVAPAKTTVTTGDGTVTVSDALLAMRYAMGTVTNINVNAADVDGDGNVTITDAVTILRMAMTA